MIIISNTIFVGNLNFDTTSDDIEELFGQSGSVLNVTLPKDRETGRPRGFGFVEFADEASVMKAIDMFDGYEFNGRTLRINMAEDKQNRSRGPSNMDSFGGGRGPRGGFKPKKPKGSRRNIRAQKRGY